MGRVKAYLGDLLVAAGAGLMVGACLGPVAAIVGGLAGWDGAGVLLFALPGAGVLAGVLAGIVYRSPMARRRRERPRTWLEILIARNRRERRAERRARWRHWWNDIVPFVVAGVLGVGAIMAFSVAGVVGVMQLMGVEDPRYIPVGVIVGVGLGALLSLPLVVGFVRGGGAGGGGGGGGGWSGGADDAFFDGGGE